MSFRWDVEETSDGTSPVDSRLVDRDFYLPCRQDCLRIVDNVEHVVPRGDRLVGVLGRVLLSSDLRGLLGNCQVEVEVATMHRRLEGVILPIEEVGLPDGENMEFPPDCGGGLAFHWPVWASMNSSMG